MLPNGTPIYRDTAIKHDDLKKIVGRVRASLTPDHAYDVADSFALYKLLLQPADKLGATKRLFIVPDRELFSIPFAALVTSDQGDAYKTLADDYHKALAPSPVELRDDYPRIAWLAKQNLALTAAIGNLAAAVAADRVVKGSRHRPAHRHRRPDTLRQGESARRRDARYPQC